MKTVVKNKKTKKEIYLDKAIKRISNITDISDYSKAIRIVRGNLYKNNLFQSIDEIMLILELAKNGLRRFQKIKLNKHKVAILLPEIKIIIELGNKDLTHLKTHPMVALLGCDWEVIGVSGSFINENIIKLYPEIASIYYTDWRYFPCRNN